MLGNVQQKVSCVYETKVVEEPSSKRSYQPYKVVASETVKENAISSNIDSAVVTEKLDGTCVLIQEFSSQPWLWARLDRKANKAADRKFKKYQLQLRKWEVGGKDEASRPAPYQWNITTDFKDVPPGWIPASGVNTVDGVPQPDVNGHIPGWVPVDPTGRQHLWHLQPVDFNRGVGLFLQENQDEGHLEIILRPLKEFEGATLELIGTNVNGNPYKLGSKQHPLHLLARHGSIRFKNRPPILYNELKKWFEDTQDGSVEGIVWHCANGTLFKVHRHHFDLPWPVDKLKLHTSPVKIVVDIPKYELGDTEQSLLLQMGDINGVKYESVQKIFND